MTGKETPTERIYRKGDHEWTRVVGGKVAANRLHDHLRSLWNWAIEQGYASASPFIRTRKGTNRLKHDEQARDRRLRNGEEDGLKAHANQHLHDVIVAALETGMRKGEILSLVWQQVRKEQNEIYLPGGKTKSRRPRKIPVSPALWDVLRRREYGATRGRRPERFKFGAQQFVFGDETGGRITDVKTAWENAVLNPRGVG